MLIPTEHVAIKTVVRDKYARIARQEESCCGDSCSMIGDAYDGLEGYVAEADLSLGCGLPTEHADLAPGQTVLDLGSGAGLDAFVARWIVGPNGRVLGLDFTEDMVGKARSNARSLGYDNVEFYLGDIEKMPFEAASVDVILSNCVLNLVPDKAAAFAEMYRVLRPGGHYCISDVVWEGRMPDSLRRSMEHDVGCVAGAMQRAAYLEALNACGFADVQVVTQRPIAVPAEIAAREDSAAVGNILSVTVTGRKPR